MQMNWSSVIMHRSRSSTRRKTDRARRGNIVGPKSTAISARRRARQKRRDVDDASSGKDAVDKHAHRRRYVKSKPPTAMPGGRVIASGQGTLTEVSKSFYVAYGSTALGSTTTDIHLVVPVKDELQEVTDDDAAPEVAPMKGEELTQDFGCASLLSSPRLSLGNGDQSACGFGEDSGLNAVMCMQPDSPSSQMQMNWYSAAPWSIKPSSIPFTTPPPTNFSCQMPSPSEFETGMFGDVFPQATRDPSPLTQEFPGVMPGPPAGNKPDVSLPVHSQSTASEIPKSQTNDCSYFHLAEELMPETKQVSRGTTNRPQFSPRYWDVASPHPRCGQGEMAMMGFPNNLYPPCHICHPYAWASSWK